MICTYIRSSSYNTFDFCENKYFIDYNLGFRSPANKKAEKGTIVHKGLELLARIKLAQQKCEASIYDEELGYFELEELTPEICIQLAYHNISKKSEALYDWNKYDYKDCHEWFFNALKYNEGMFHPFNQNIIQPEQYFDFTIEKPWAWYNYKLPNGSKLEGYLALKGTLDLIVKLDKDTYELIDYKTGKRIDWNTGEEKTYEKLCKDPQLHIYHYAAARLFPDIKHFIVTIFFIQDGGAFSLNFNENNLNYTEKILEKRFNKIRNNHKPKTIYPDWKCTKLCHFGKHDINDNKVDDFKASACQTIKKEILTLGMDRVISNRGRDKSFAAYGSGGGTTR